MLEPEGAIESPTNGRMLLLESGGSSNREVIQPLDLKDQKGTRK